MATTLHVGAGQPFTTIQDALAAAADGDTIIVDAGTYSVSGIGGAAIVVDHDVTILGPNAGIAGTGVRGAEAIIDGGFEITANGVTIDGFTFTNGALAFGSFDAVHVSADNVTVTNSVFQEDGGDDTFAMETEFGAGITGLAISNNLLDGWDAGVSLQQGTVARLPATPSRTWSRFPSGSRERLPAQW